MIKQPKKIFYLMKILGLAIFLGPIFLKKLNILAEMSKPTIIILIIIGSGILISSDFFKRKEYENPKKEDNFN